MLNFKMEYFDSKNYSEIINCLDTDINNVARISSKTTFMLVGQIFRMIGGIIGLCLISWKLTIVVFCFIPLKFIIVNLFAKLRRKNVEDYLAHMQNFYSWFGDSINGVKEIKLWNLKKTKIDQFAEKQKELLKKNQKLQYLDTFNLSADIILIQVIIFLLYILGVYLIIGNSLTVGGLFAFLSYSSYVTSPISTVLNLKYSYQDVFTSGKRLFAFLNTETEETRHIFHSSKSDFVEVNKDLLFCFNNVFFSYNKDHPVIQGLNLKIKKGEKIAIIGSNGSGKTSLINLLLRLYTPTSGNIYFNGVDIQSLDIDKYRENFSVVTQMPYLFNDSIRNNINFFNADPEVIKRACRLSNADGFIEKMPNKYNTVVGSNGAKLSGGERQKVAVSRIFINNSSIVIFDEANNNLDAVSDNYLTDLVTNCLKDKTVIFITHRDNILNSVDRVLQFSNHTVQEIEIRDTVSY